MRVKVPTTTVSGKPITEGLNIVGIAAKQIEDHGDNVVIAWQVKLFNKGSDPMEAQWVNISFRDASDFEIDSASEKSSTLPANEPVTVTATHIMSKKLWQSVDSYVAKTGL